MKNKSTIYVVLLVVVVVIIIIAGAMKPDKVDWTPTYATKDKVPLGLYIFNEEAPEFFKNDTIQKLTATPYEFFEKLYDYENKKYKERGNFININEDNEIDEESAKELLYYADHGNTVFLSMKSFPQPVLDSLKIKLGDDFTMQDSTYLSLSEKKPVMQYMFKGGTGYTFLTRWIQNV